MADEEKGNDELQSENQLSKALSAAGLPTPVDLRNGTEADVHNAERALYTLLSFYHRSLDAKEELEEQRRRLHADAKRAEQREKRLLESIEQKDKEINRLSQLQSQTKSQAADDVKKARSERDTAAKKASDLQQKYTQLSHEMRKRDKAYSALQEKFNNLVSGKEKTVKPFMESHGRLRKRATWQTDDRPANRSAPLEEMQRSVAEATNSKINEILAENRELKDALQSARQQIHNLSASASSAYLEGTRPMAQDTQQLENGNNVAAHSVGAEAHDSSDDENEPDDADGEEASPPGPHVMGLPYKMARPELERGIESDIESLRERLQALGQRSVRRVPRDALYALPENVHGSEPAGA